jgi:hypothetical protein
VKLKEGGVVSICGGEGMWARATEGGVLKPVHSPTELSVCLASGLLGTAPAELKLEWALRAGALCSTGPSARERLERALSAGALAGSAELAGLTLGRALRAGALGCTSWRQ